MDSYRKNMLRTVVRGKYLFFFLLSSIGFLAFDIWINELSWYHFSVEHFKVWFVLARTVSLLTVSLLVGLVLTLVLLKIQETKTVKKRVTGLGALGAFGGLLAGGCAGCIAGLFPAFMGLFGVSVGMTTLPFYGFEIQAVSAVLLGASVYYLTKAPVCSVK